jgi:hypothetical protein
MSYNTSRTLAALGLLFLVLTVLQAQKPVAAVEKKPVPRKVYTNLLDPREYPDDARRSVKPPAWSLFGNQTHFTTLRQFQLRDNKLVDFAGDFERYTKTFDLGDVIWPNSRFLTATNIPEMVAEMKRRNLFMYQIWGYVPGSGPGQWHQFELSKETSDLFDSQLGDHWLGMDMGEQDGRYVLTYAAEMYPPSADRLRQYLNFHNHMEAIGNDLRNRMATLVAITFGHYLVKEGLYTMVGAEAAQMHPNGQIFYAFNRGAGKQYGVPWFGNASVYNRWGSKSYGPRGRPTKGTSLALMKRLLYSHILYNSMVVGFENGWFDGEALSPIGRIQQGAQKWVREVGQPGVMQTPIAVMNDFYAGWIFPNYNKILYRVWGNLPYGQGDYLMNDVFDILYPGYRDSSFFHDEKGFATATPYGDSADALLSDAPGWLLSRYPVLVVAGELSGGAEVRDKLQAYVEQGGRLFITAGSLRNLPGGLAGIQSEGRPKSFPAGQKVSMGISSLTEDRPFELYPLQLPRGAQILAGVNAMPAIVAMQAGKGSATVFASPFGVSSVSAVKDPVVRVEDKPLPNPYPVLRHVRTVLESAFRDQKYFDVGEGLSLITCRRGKGDYTLGISNNSLRQLPMHIVSHVGSLRSVEELPLDQSEKQAVGYLPEGFENAPIGVSGKNSIAGGDIRIFRVRVDETAVEEIPHSVPPPNPKGRFLPLRGMQKIEDEILSRPTFFQHFDGVAVDWKYLADRETSVLQKEAVWLGLQKVRVLVDLTSGINLFPDLRLVNNIEPQYRASMETIRDVSTKMQAIGAHDLLLSLHKPVENNITLPDTWKAFEDSVRQICRDAASRQITVYLRFGSGNKLPGDLDEALQFIQKVDAPNLRLAPSTALLLESKTDLPQLAARLKGRVGLWLLNTPATDVAGRLWNAYGPVAGSGRAKDLAALFEIEPDSPILADVAYSSHDQEYTDAVELDTIQGDLRTRLNIRR